MRSHEIIWLFADDEVSLDEISKVEASLGIKFPQDYLECVRKNHGGHPKPDVIAFGNQETIFNFLLSFNPSSSEYLPQVYEDVSDRLVEGVVPFASDPGGDLFCFDYRKSAEKPTIVYWDHEIAFLNAYAGLQPVCETFTEFLSMLYELDEEH